MEFFLNLLRSVAYGIIEGVTDMDGLSMKLIYAKREKFV